MKMKEQIDEIFSLTKEQLQIAHKNLLVGFDMLSKENDRLNAYIKELEYQLIKQNEN